MKCEKCGSDMELEDFNGVSCWRCEVCDGEQEDFREDD